MASSSVSRNASGSVRMVSLSRDVDRQELAGERRQVVINRAELVWRREIHDPEEPVGGRRSKSGTVDAENPRRAQQSENEIFVSRARWQLNLGHDVERCTRRHAPNALNAAEPRHRQLGA